jgi:hypothetical protein
MIVGWGQEHVAGLPEGCEAKSNEALCDVAWNALRASHVASEVTYPDPAVAAEITSEERPVNAE